MQIAIADRDRTPTWSIPGTEILLTFENPGPIDIDVKKLNSTQKKVISIALARAVIIGKGAEELHEVKSTQSVAKSYAAIEHDVYTARPFTVVEQKVPATKDPMAIQKVVKEARDARTTEISSLLDKGVGTVKKQISEFNLQDLRIAQDLESKGKARKAVITLINDMIAKINSEVSQTIARSQGSVVPTTRPESLQITAIEESDITDVEVKMGADEEQ